MRRAMVSSALVAVLVAAAACNKEEKPAAPPAPIAEKAPPGPTPGIDLAKKVVRIGALNDESGPGAGIGKPYANGKRLLARAVAGGAVKILPEGWTIQLVEKDHAYNPQQAVQLYNAIKDDVLFIATSFGTPNTLPLRPMLQRDGLVAYPASNSSEMGQNPYTPLLTTSYKLEAMRAMDWVVEKVGDPKKIKAGLIYQQDDYGKDGLIGWNEAARRYGVEIWDKYGKDMGNPDMYTLISYGQGIIELEALSRAFAAGPVTRASYLTALRSLKNYDAHGLSQPLDVTKFPYEPARRARVLKPKLAEKSWEIIAPYAEPNLLTN